MYLALFLTPWMGMYALSTIGMNHRPSFTRQFGGQLPWVKEGEQALGLQFSPGATPKFIGAEILQALHIDSDFSANLTKDKQTLIVVCNHLIPRRITYSLPDGKALIERQKFVPQLYLETLHRRRGFGGASLITNSWAVSGNSGRNQAEKKNYFR